VNSLAEFGVRLDQVVILNEAEGEGDEEEDGEEGAGGSQLMKRPGYKNRYSFE
jgi:hypothetical protein